MDHFTLRARWLLPVTSPPIEGGYVGVVNGRIANVGRTDPHLGKMIDLGDVIVMPGLINAHTHLEFSAATQPLGAYGLTLPQWIRLVIAERKRSDRDAAAAMVAGSQESLNAGVTVLGEIATGPPALDQPIGARPSMVTFQEVIAFSEARIESALSDVERRLHATLPPAGISPHAPYTVHPRLVERLVALAKLRGLPMAMHLAESREELRLLSHGDGPFRDLLYERSMWDAEAIPLGTRPIDYLKVLAEAPRSVVIHGNYLDNEEIYFLAARRDHMSVVFCPRTHAYFAHVPYPLSAMLEAGARVAFGTDSRASNPDLNLLEELRFASRQFPKAPPAELLKMATINGATALGLEMKTGSLAAGKRADLLALPCASGRQDPYEAITREPLQPAAVWLAGIRAS
jgi:cytosine/adenosine deaminase-related metal-dependent hydrolase